MADHSNAQGTQGKDNRSGQPAAPESSGLTGSPPDGVGSDNKGAGGHAHSTSFVPAVGTFRNSENQGNQPAGKVS